MTFAQPAWLVLLSAVPLLWWLHRRITAPREVAVASVEALRGSVTDATSALSRRRVDVELVAWLLGVVCLSIAAAGPTIGAPAPSVLVVVDGSASGNQRGDDGLTLRESALQAALRAVEATGSDTTVEVLALGSSGPAFRRRPADWSQDGDPGPAPSHDLHADGLPATLAPAHGFARRNGYEGFVLVTDRDVGDLPGVVVAGPSSTPRPDVGIVDVLLDGEQASVSVLRHGDGPATISVRVGDDVRSVPVPRLVPGEDPVVVVAAPAPPPGGTAHYLVQPGAAPDGLIENDVCMVRRIGGVRSVRLTGAGPAGARSVRALLDVLGIAVASSALAEVDVEIVVGGPPATPQGADPPRLHLAPTAGECADVAVVGDPRVVTGAQLSAAGVLERALPDPATSLTTTGLLDPRGNPPRGAWRDRSGLVAAVFSRHAIIALDGEDDRTTWTSDASYPVLVATCLEALGGGPDRLETVGSLPATEARRAAAPPAPIDPGAVRAIVRSAALDGAAAPRGGGLAAVGAALLALATLLAAARARRFSGGTVASRTAG